VQRKTGGGRRQELGKSGWSNLTNPMRPNHLGIKKLGGKHLGVAKLDAKTKKEKLGSKGRGAFKEYRE